MNHTVLEPQCFGADFNGRFRNEQYVLRPAEYMNHIHLSRNVQKGGV